MSHTPAIPLLERPPGDIFAYQGGRHITVSEFLGDVRSLIDLLPDRNAAINLVRDRYQFTVTFVALVATGKCNLLPPNATKSVQARLADELDSVAVIHDGLDVAPGLASLRYPVLTPGTGASLPDIDARQVAMQAFTSGSSGVAKPIPKTLGMLKGAASIYEDLLIPQGASVIATVPPQHMYGLELASLQALWSPVRFTSAKPLFPAEVTAELARTPGPRVLVTTPLHLRALLESGQKFPALARVLCATAPLSAGLARRAETAFNAELLDVYGCSEAGCMATRRLSRTDRWSPFPGLDFSQQNGDTTVVTAAHFDEPVSLADRVMGADDGTFSLEGRLGDLINVAGKRGSLSEITALLLKVPGVSDAAVFMPDGEGDNQRPAGLFAGSAEPRAVRKSLAEWLDPVFIPRPLMRVDRLPRNAASKLPRDALLACLEQQRQPRSS